MMRIMKIRELIILPWDTSTAIKKSVWMREASIVIPAVWRAEGLMNAESMDL